MHHKAFRSGHRLRFVVELSLFYVYGGIMIPMVNQLLVDSFKIKDHS